MALVLTPAEWAQHAADAGFEGWQVAMAVAAIGGESGYDAYAVNVIEKELRADGTPNPAYRSIDLGGVQWNSHWWPQLSIPERLTPETAVAEMHRVWKREYDDTDGHHADKAHAAWSTWNAYLNGGYEEHLPTAVDAAREIGAM